MKGGLVCLLLVAFLSLPVVSDAATTPALTLEPVAIGGFGIGVPKGWFNELVTTPVVDKSGSITITDIAGQLVSEAPAKAILGIPNNNSVEFEVDVLRAPGVTAQLLADRWQAKLRQSLGAKAPITITPVTLSTGVAYKVHSVADQGSLGVEASDRYFIVSDRIAYEFLAFAPALSWSQYAPTFAKIARSFGLLEPPNLGGLQLQKSQVGPSYTASVVPNGKSFIGIATLDLCAASFPSDALRIGRLQMAYGSPDQTLPIVSNEVATYIPGGGAEALSELRMEAKACSTARGVQLQDNKGDTAVLHATLLSDPGLLPGAVAVRVHQVITNGTATASTTEFFIYQVSGDTLSAVYATANNPSYPLVTVATAQRVALHAAEQAGRNITGRSLAL